MISPEVPISDLWHEALLQLQRSRVRPRLRAAVILFGQGEPARPVAARFGYADPRPITRAARRFGLDVLHRINRDTREIERLAVDLGLEPEPLLAERLAASLATARNLIMASSSHECPSKAGWKGRA